MGPNIGALLDSARHLTITDDRPILPKNKKKAKITNQWR